MRIFFLNLSLTFEMAVALSRGPMLTKSMLEDLTRPLKELKSGLYTSDKKSFLEIDFAPRCDLFLRSNFHHFKSMLNKKV